MSFDPSTALHPPAHIHQYALVNAPCLILYKTGESKYGAILRNYFFAETLKSKIGNVTPGMDLDHSRLASSSLVDCFFETADHGPHV